MLSTKLYTSLNKAEKMILYYVGKTSLEPFGYTEVPFEFVKLLRPKVVVQRLEMYKPLMKPKFIPIIERLQKKLNAEVIS
jgi:hypothetical protein